MFCEGTGIDLYLSLPAEGPSEYSMGEPPVLEPCICQFVPVPCRACGTLWRYDQPACTNPGCPTHDWTDDDWERL